MRNSGEVRFLSSSRLNPVLLERHAARYTLCPPCPSSSLSHWKACVTSAYWVQPRRRSAGISCLLLWLLIDGEMEGKLSGMNWTKQIWQGFILIASSWGCCTKWITGLLLDGYRLDSCFAGQVTWRCASVAVEYDLMKSRSEVAMPTLCDRCYLYN